MVPSGRVQAHRGALERLGPTSTPAAFPGGGPPSVLDYRIPLPQVWTLPGNPEAQEPGGQSGQGLGCFILTIFSPQKTQSEQTTLQGIARANEFF